MTFTIVQGDTEPSLVSTLTDAGVPIDLSSVSNINFYMEDQFQRLVIDDDISGRANIVDASAGEVEYLFSQSDTSDVGTYYAEWEVVYDTDGNGNPSSIETFPSDGKVEIEVVEEIQ